MQTECCIQILRGVALFMISMLFSASYQAEQALSFSSYTERQRLTSWPHDTELRHNWTAIIIPQHGPQVAPIESNEVKSPLPKDLLWQLTMWPMRLCRYKGIHDIIFLGKIRQSRTLKSRRETSSTPRTHRQSMFDHYENVENLSRYMPGGYCPIVIGEELCSGRYQVIHKLGFGSYSTVWLARDRLRSRYVTIKIATSDAKGVSIREVETLKYLQEPAGAHSASIGHMHVPIILDEFTVDSANGQHRCYVTELLRCSLAASKYETRTNLFSADVARAAAAQLIFGVAYMHSRGIAHGGKNLLVVRCMCWCQWR